MTDRFSSIHKFTAIFMLFALFAPIGIVGVDAQTMQKVSAKTLTDDQKILHVLNRLGFGARPGDVERVKAMGIDKYIEQQLNPNSISDALAESKVKNLDVLSMSNEEIFAKYPTPNAIMLAVAKENGLTKADVAQLKPKNNKNNTDVVMKGDAMTADGKMMSPDATKNSDTALLNDEQRQKLQQQVAEIYRKNNLGRPQQITQQLDASRIMRAVYSERQLQEQMVDFWSNHFNVYANKAAVRWFLPEYDRDVIRPNALGNFKNLLAATAKSPAMLYYLDNFQSVSPNMQANNRRAANAINPQQLERMMNNPKVRERIKQRQGINDEQLDRRIELMQNGQKLNINGKVVKPKQTRGINENYARELMELHTLGVDGGYTQQDVQEMARCFTGWTIIDPRGYKKMAASFVNGMDDKRVERQARVMGLPENAESGTFYFNERAHDQGEKIVLGQKINEGGMKDGLKAIDILVNIRQRRNLSPANWRSNLSAIIRATRSSGGLPMRFTIRRATSKPRFAHFSPTRNFTRRKITAPKLKLRSRSSSARFARSARTLMAGRFRHCWQKWANRSTVTSRRPVTRIWRKIGSTPAHCSSE